ncbi:MULTISPECIES: sugar ABC transporter permease [unclassified Eisenbergiella]|jgi:arabinogalactan oligomer/maltooligosaccharide transport system permease protein|uniref:sugar ABC transporter permease n=1 Tax=unclassified Eisenbergiella TaxID=2652273 RepID=UPI001FAA28BB|nr:MULTISPECIES: ABC transporter permease subunit [unclassified Eisenbergiella]BDF47993.1 ABC transporter permease [Lachnospiraceae bacterium]GKH44069.1 ABC transporter permease [Lachnospiraceae bacterium]
MMSVRSGKKARKAALLLAVNLFFLVLCFLVLVPVLYAFSVSLHAGNSLLGSDFTFLPRQMTLANYRAVFVEEPILRWFSNSMLMAAAAVAVSLGTGIPAAYVFSRKRFPGRRVILRLLILLYAFPALLSMTALYKLLSPMGLINSRLGLIIVYTGTMAVFALWNMKGYFDTIPVEIEEAAMIDGARPVQIVMKIVLPLARPTIVVTGMMVLIYVWNEYIFAINFMTGEDTFTLAAGLYSLQATEMSGSWPVFAAASIVVSIPILLIFFLLQKNMTTGLTSGGVKG